MTDSVDPSLLLTDEMVGVLTWRVEELDRHGCEHLGAVELAGRSDIDLHRALELLDAGCSTELLLRILL